MAEMRVNKIDAARRQIEVAIRLLFSNDDPVAIHTLASAGFRILRDIAHNQEIGIIQNEFNKNIRPEMKGKFWSVFNKAANFFKHADSDAKDILEDVQEEVNDGFLAMACLYYKDLGYQLTPTMQVMVTWYYSLNPDLLLDAAPNKQFLINELKAFRSENRREQLAAGKALLDLELSKQSFKNI